MRLDPRVTLAWLAACLCCAVLLGTVGLAAAAACAAAVAIRTGAAPAVLRGALAVAPLAVMVAMLDALGGRAAAGAAAGARLLVLSAVGLAFSRSIDGSRATAALRALHVPDAVVFVLVAGARSTVLAAEDVAALGVAARLRGVGLDGPPWRRIHGAATLLVPLVVLTIRRGLQLGESMEARGHGAARRTSRTVLRWTPRDTAAALGAVALVVTVAVVAA